MDKAADLECKSVKYSSPDSPQGSQSSASSGKKIRTVQDNPKLRLPFKQGWRREVVQRGAGKDDHRPGVVRADAYYFSPDRKKLRSIIEVERYLKESGSTLDIRSFSFSRQPLGAGPQYEKVRQARPTTTGVTSARPVPKRPPVKPSGTAAAAPASGAGSATAAAQNKVPKKRSSNRAITLGKASSVIQVPSVPGLPSKPQLPRKHSLMEKSRRAFAWKAMELKKKAPVFQNEPVRPPKAGRAGRGRGRGRGGGAASGEERIRVRRPWLLAEVDEAGRLAVRQPPDNSTTVEYFRLVRASVSPHSSEQISIGQRRLVAPCSLFCFFDSPGSPLALPSVQCLVCRCLSHPVCVGLESRCTSFICLGCYRGVCSGWGFDGVGDQLPADSGPDSDAASDASVEEYIPPAPLGGSPIPIAGGTAELLALSAGLGRGSMAESRARGMKRPRGRPRTAVPSPFAGAMGDLAVPRPARGRGSRGPRGARAALAVSLGRGAAAAAGESSRVSPAAPLVSAALSINTSSPVQATTPKAAPVVSSGLFSPPGVAQGRTGAAGGAAGVRGPPLLTPRPVVRPAGSAGAPGRPATAQGPVSGGPQSGPRPAKKRSWK